MLMPEEVLKKFHEKIKRQDIITFASVMIVGWITHGYMLANKLPNYDDILGINGFGATFALGRWFLWVIGAGFYHLKFCYSMPWLNGIIAIMLIALSAVLVTRMFEVKKNYICVFIGGIMISIPAWTGVMFFMFTSVYYALAIFLATLSVYVVYKSGKYLILGSILLMCALGIYQTYLFWSIGIMLALLLVKCLVEEEGVKTILKEAARYLTAVMVGVGLYCVATLVSLVITHQEIRVYRGIDSAYEKRGILGAFYRMIKRLFSLCYNNEMELSYNVVLKFSFTVFILFIMMVIINKTIVLIKDKKIVDAILIVSIMALTFLSVMGSEFLTAEAYLLMRYSVCVIPVTAIVLFERISIVITGRKERISFFTSWGMLLAISGCIFSWIVYANGQYLSMHLSYEQSYSYYTTLITRIKCVDGYEADDTIVFVGNVISDESYYENHIMDTFLISGRDANYINTYSREGFLRYYCGLEHQIVWEYDDKHAYDIQSMPVYPADGSIQKLDDVIVVKLEEGRNE